MNLGLMGRKVGMMRIFMDDGRSVPVTVLDVSDNRVTQVKTVESDGYSAVQVGAGQRRANRVTKALAGHYAKAGTGAAERLKEYRVSDEEASSANLGDVVGLDGFAVGQKVDVTATSIGKGFAGTIKRHNFSSNRASHGNSKAHRKPGSIGQAQDPGRIFPGKKMAGQLGNKQCTVQNLVVERIDAERNLIMVKGAVPGHKGGQVVVRAAVKG